MPVRTALQEQLFTKYLSSPEGRARLVAASRMPAERMMEQLCLDPRSHPFEAVQNMVRDMECISSEMGDEEKYEHRNYIAMLDGLRQMRDDIHAHDPRVGKPKVRNPGA
jgi:hypothetical protein